MFCLFTCYKIKSRKWSKLVSEIQTLEVKGETHSLCTDLLKHRQKRPNLFILHIHAPEFLSPDGLDDVRMQTD